MAEAAVEDRISQRFYCHKCNLQFENASANFTCPHCSSGFIEELEVSADNPDEILDVTDDDDEPYNMLNYGLDSFLASSPDERRTGRRLTHEPNRRRRYASVHPHHRIIRPRTLTRLASTNLRQHTPFENLIQEFIVNLGVGVNWGGYGNMQLFLGNPGDYAWGREGLDAIVTQLLNQMDGAGPPPVSKEIIDALPIVEVTEQQVESKLQCSVCWEDFVSKEPVRQLPCQHIYHEPCIRPWLELHGTCPICRQNLTNGDSSSNDGNQAGANTGGSPFNTLQQLFQAVQNSGNRSNSPSSSMATRGSDSSTSSNSSSRDSRM